MDDVEKETEATRLISSNTAETLLSSRGEGSLPRGAQGDEMKRIPKILSFLCGGYLCGLFFSIHCYLSRPFNREVRQID